MLPGRIVWLRLLRRRFGQIDRHSHTISAKTPLHLCSLDSIGVGVAATSVSAPGFQLSTSSSPRGLRQAQPTLVWAVAQLDRTSRSFRPLASAGLP